MMELYEITVRGECGEECREWFENLAIEQDGDGNTRLSGKLPDQAALMGLLLRFHELNLTVLAVKKSAVEES